MGKRRPRDTDLPKAQRPAAARHVGCPARHPHPPVKGLAVRMVSQVPRRAHSAAERSGLSLEGLRVIAPHAAVGLDVALACHADLGGLQEANAGCRDRQEGGCFFSTYHVASLVPERLHDSSLFTFTTVLEGGHPCPPGTEEASKAWGVSGSCPSLQSSSATDTDSF